MFKYALTMRLTPLARGGSRLRTIFTIVYSLGNVTETLLFLVDFEESGKMS
ncbi:hypothetical protein [Thalassotalea litorea]|uniref:hypothetical protein n=1 Tax=Thalassotalea litorea TaxID=2020715 RepID=UPI003734FB80